MKTLIALLLAFLSLNGMAQSICMPASWSTIIIVNATNPIAGLLTTRYLSRVTVYPNNGGATEQIVNSPTWEYVYAPPGEIQLRLIDTVIMNTKSYRRIGLIEFVLTNWVSSASNTTTRSVILTTNNTPNTAIYFDVPVIVGTLIQTNVSDVDAPSIITTTSHSQWNVSNGRTPYYIQFRCLTPLGVLFGIDYAVGANATYQFNFDQALANQRFPQQGYFYRDESPFFNSIRPLNQGELDRLLIFDATPLTGTIPAVSAEQ